MQRYFAPRTAESAGRSQALHFKGFRHLLNVTRLSDGRQQGPIHANGKQNPESDKEATEPLKGSGHGCARNFTA
jgi:hypothetical protein